MNPEVEPLFTPITVRGVTLRNRIVMSPMTRSFSPQGVPGSDVAAYYRRRAVGETGLLVTEGVGIDHPAALGEAGLGESDLPHMYGAAALAAGGFGIWAATGFDACVPKHRQSRRISFACVLCFCPA